MRAEKSETYSWQLAAKAWAEATVMSNDTSIYAHTEPEHLALQPPMHSGQRINTTTQPHGCMVNERKQTQSNRSFAQLPQVPRVESLCESSI